MSLRGLAYSAEVQLAAWALLHFVWQACVVAALLRLALAVVPRARARLRYALACCALALLSVSPPLTFWYLRSPVPFAAFVPPCHHTVQLTARGGWGPLGGGAQ